MQSTVKDSHGEFLRVADMSTVDRCKVNKLESITGVMQRLMKSGLRWKHQVVLVARDERNDLRAYVLQESSEQVIRTIKGIADGELGNRTKRRQRREAGGLSSKGKKASVKSNVGGSGNGEQRETAV